MIFLPNKFEIYCYFLRNTIQHLIIKNGLKPSYIKNLTKIHKAESLFCDEILPLDIKDFSTEIFKAIFLKLIENNKQFHFKIKDIGTFLINKKSLTSLLLILSKNSSGIEISVYNEKILIKAKNFSGEINIKLIKKLNGIYFYELKNHTLSILINAPKTSKTSLETEKDWEYILNPLSVVNIYLN